MRLRRPQVPGRRLSVWLAGIISLLVAVLLRYGISPLPQHALVRRVVDGDTIQLLDGRLVRYIGIDTPELRRREGSRWVMDPEPFALAATEANRRLVEGKTVRLEYDVQPRDRYGRLLAYVYVDERMVNAELLETGYAHLLTIPPDVRYAEEFRRLAAGARREHRGLWAAER